jgi:hypothetical protein
MKSNKTSDEGRLYPHKITLRLTNEQQEIIDLLWERAGKSLYSTTCMTKADMIRQYLNDGLRQNLT